MRLAYRLRSCLHLTRPRVTLGTIPLFPGIPLVALPVSLGPAELSYHLHLMGLSGMGKSKLLAHYAAQLILQGRAVGVLDPHADLAHDVLRLLLCRGYFRRPDATRRVLYVDFSHPTRFIPFNVLRQPYDTYETARNLVEACTRAWPTLAGGAAPQFENLLLAAASVLIENDLPLTELPRLLTDGAFRASLLVRVRDPQVRDFFRFRYDAGHGSGLNESTLRRAFLLTYPPPLRYALGQQENALNFRRLMDSQTSVICNLGGLDAQTQRLLGCLITVGLEEAALSRADLPTAARRPYHLIMDEFSQFSAQSEEALERVLALTRKYGLFLTLAHQTFSQLGRKLQGALQNTTFLTFRVGPEDAAWAANRVGDFSPYRVKYVTQTHPVIVSHSEQAAEWEYEVQHLRAREALLRLRGRTVKFRTASVPTSTPAGERDLQRLMGRYAETLLMPRVRVEADDHSGAVASDTYNGVSSDNLAVAPPAGMPQLKQATARSTTGHTRVAPLPLSEDADLPKAEVPSVSQSNTRPAPENTS